MSAITEKTVGQLVAESPARARVFEKHRIDYCCAGKIPLADACQRRKVDYDTVVRELEACDATAPASNETNWSKASLADLADNIVGTHHKYLWDELPRLDAMTARVAKVHGDHAPEVVQIRTLFVEFRREMEEHATKEEQILFPWIKRLEASGAAGSPIPGATVANPIRCMEHEHDSAGQILEQFRKLSNDYQPPADACNTWLVLYASLETLEQDMHTHIHKENSILFPRALAIEQGAA